MSRIERARRRVTFARYAIGVAAAAALAAFAGAARLSHPGTHAAQSSPSTTATSTAAASSDDDFFGDDDSSSGSLSSNIAPSTGASPQVQSAAS
jgi:hypothetical protein